jgi:hypothetical protein
MRQPDTTAHRPALILLGSCSVVALACLLVNHPAAPVVFGVAAFAFPPILIALGAARRGRIGPLAIPLLLIAVLLEGSVAVMLLLSGAGESGKLWLGLPPATAVLLYGLWLSPLLAVSFVYAWHFGRFGPREEDLRRIRALSRNEGEGN